MSSENKNDILRASEQATALSRAAKAVTLFDATRENSFLRAAKELEYLQSARETAISRLSKEMGLFRFPELSSARTLQVALDAISSSTTSAGFKAMQQHLAAIPNSLNIAATITQQFSSIHSNLLNSSLGFHSDLSRINAQMLAVTDVYSQFKLSLQSIALSPSLIATNHLSATARSIERWAKDGRNPASLLSSIAMTESQVVAHEADIIEYADEVDFNLIDDDLADFDPFGIATQNVYQVQRSEFIFIARKNPDLLEDETTLNRLPSVNCFNKARSVCSLVTFINKQCHIIGRDDMFKLTTRLVESLVALPNVIATNQRVFGEFIDCLYFVIYEGAGKDNLRFSDLVSDQESEPVWQLKHFRNFYCRHDVEHGKEKDIRTKEVRLGEIFQGLIEVMLPRNRSDFQTAQFRYLVRLEELLLLISGRLDAIAREKARENAKGGAGYE